MLSLLYELMGNAAEHGGKKYLMVDDYMLDKLLDKIKEIIGIPNLDNSKILIDTGDKFPYDLTLKKVVILKTCVIKDDNKFYQQLFLEHTFHCK